MVGCVAASPGRRAIYLIEGGQSQPPGETGGTIHEKQKHITPNRPGVAFQTHAATLSAASEHNVSYEGQTLHVASLVARRGFVPDRTRKRRGLQIVMLSETKHLGCEGERGFECEHDVLCEGRTPSASSGQALHFASLVQDDEHQAPSTRS